MINLDADHSALHVLAELRALSGLVSPGCYLVVEDTIVNGNPVEPDFGPGPGEALEQWLTTAPPFEVDRERERLLATFNKGGYLRRIGEPGELSPAPPPSSPATAEPATRATSAPAEPKAPLAGAGLAETRKAVAELVEDGSQVLDLGCGSGELAALLREKGCTVVGVEADLGLAAQAEEICEHVHRRDLDDPGLADDLGESSFDAVVGVHALERGGPRLLEVARSHLSPQGRLVLAVANAAHASARLALLEGELERVAPGRPYTLDTLDRELADAGFALARIGREQSDAPERGGAGDPLSRTIAARLAGDLDARTLRLLTVSYPLPRADLELQRSRITELARRTDELADELVRLEGAEAEAANLREELAGTRTELSEREPELRSLRDAVATSSSRVRELRGSLTAASAKAEAESAEAARLGLQVRRLEAELQSTQEELERRHREAVGAGVRLQRIEQTLPFRAYHRLRTMPPLSWIAARRARGYYAELERARDENS